MFRPVRRVFLLSAFLLGLSQTHAATNLWTSAMSTGNQTALVAVSPANPKTASAFQWGAVPASASALQKTTDGGMTWTNLTPGGSSTANPVLAVSAAAPDAVFAQVQNTFYASADGGAS